MSLLSSWESTNRTTPLLFEDTMTGSTFRDDLFGDETAVYRKQNLVNSLIDDSLPADDPFSRRLSKAVKVRANDRVAFAGRRFQTLSIANRDASTSVADQSSLLQHAGNHTDSRTLHTEHDRQKLMAQLEVLLVHPVVRHQQPAGTPLLHRVHRVARDGLHPLRDDDLGGGGRTDDRRFLDMQTLRLPAATCGFGEAVAWPIPA